MKLIGKGLALASALTATFVLAGCGGASNSAKSSAGTGGASVTETSPTTNGGVNSVTRATATTTTETTTTSTTSTSTTPVNAGECGAAVLKPVLISSQGAAGTIFYVVALRNIGSTSCRAYGYPGVSFLNASGTGLRTNVTRTTTDMMGPASARSITLAPGAEASFRVADETAYQGGEFCKTATSMLIYPPDSTVALRLPLDGGGQVCGRATVIPLQAGTSAGSGG